MSKVKVSRKRKTGVKKSMGKKRSTSSRRKGSRFRRSRKARNGGRFRIVKFNEMLRPSIITKLVYCDTKTINPGSSGAKHTFAINSIYDPDVSGVGHQPFFHDNWATLYNDYKVVGFAYTVRFAPNPDVKFDTYTGTTDVYPYVDTNHEQCQLMGSLLYYTEESYDSTQRHTESSDKNCLREYPMPGVKWRYGKAYPGSSAVIRGFTKPKWVRGYGNVGGETVDDFTTIGSNPTHMQYLHVGAMSKDGNTCGKVRFDIKITYYVRYSHPKDVEEN